MKDVLFNDIGDLDVFDGDFNIGDSTVQNQSLLLQSQKGELKQYPITGVGINNFLLDENKNDLYREIRREFVRDGIKLNSITIDKESILIDAHYE
ncbi:MAG: hypothetical protein M9958_00510 [Chitinophagales bacterium]|nr:hypothetical protein [Chitinophagales bacterium]